MPASPHSPMASGEVQPYISPDAVHASLKRMAFGERQRGQGTPLDHLYLVERMIEARDAPAAETLREIAVARLLSRMIRRYLDGYCHTLNLPLSPRHSDLATATWDLGRLGTVGHAALKQWALLYYRYVRADLELDPPDICTLLSVDPRTVRRYQQAAIHRLTVALTKAEWRARRQARQRRLIAALPGETGARVIGRDGQIETAEAWLHAAPQKLLISGSLGVGKTRFARTLVERQIKDDAVDEVLWLDAPATTETIYLHLREHAALRGVRDFDLREHLLAWRMVIVIDDITALLHDVGALDMLLRDLEAAHVILIADRYVLIPSVTATLTLDPLPWVDTLALARHWWQPLQGDPAVSSTELEALAAASLGNPHALHLMINGYRHMVDETLNLVSTQPLYEQTMARLTDEARLLWHIMALTPHDGLSLDWLHHLWGSRADASLVDELLASHVITTKNGQVYLVDHARAWIAKDYERGGSARHLLDGLVGELDKPMLREDPGALWLAEHLLIERWLNLTEPRRMSWIDCAWRTGVQHNHWAVWLELLRDALAKDDEIIDFWIGRGVCARWLGHRGESEGALQQAIQVSGIAGGHDGFILQAEAEIELSVLWRLQGQYERALSLLERAGQQARRWRSSPLVERTLLERAQILVDHGSAETALGLLENTEASARRWLLEGEAWLQLNQPARCQTAALKALPLLEGNQSGLGKAYTLLARAAQAVGDRSLAHARYTQAVALLEQVGDHYSLARVYNNQALLWMDEKRDFQALELWERCENLHRRLGDRVALFAARHNLQLVRRRMTR
ncbi:MAG: hypothetical protein IT320_07885 [Anaerolineae bacterium]|nr:hypothetical protein [Anaerolineae bacterium]